ncbi:M48 family metallopeptidase [Magnetococcus sp. PR-3]|uniref:M48 family metallopeptidase n=1 Tax=Magnetococcus sp. PR-3 TaxID=3120355 RepID=UPI002FCE656B
MLEHEQHLQWQTWQVPVLFRRSKRARRLRITIGQEAVKVTMPRGVSLKHAQDFVAQKEAWIGRHWSTAQEKAPPQWDALTTGMPVMLWGEKYTLRLACGEKVVADVQKEGATLQVLFPPDCSDLVAQKAMETALKRFFTQTLRTQLEPWVNQYGERYHLQHNGLRIRAMRSRWGSCGVRNTLNFNRHLVHAPAQVVRYVVIHELAHLRHRNHGPQFWALVEQMDPHFLEHRLWLRNHGHSLGLHVAGKVL